MQETWVRSLGWEDPQEKEIAAHSSILACKIPWTAEPGRPLSMESKRLGHDWATSVHFTEQLHFNGFCCPSELEIKTIIWVCTWRRVSCKFEEERKTTRSQVTGPVVCAGISCQWLKFIIVLSASPTWVQAQSRVQLAEQSSTCWDFYPRRAAYSSGLLWMDVLSLSPHLLYSSFPNTFAFLLRKSYLFIKPFSHPTSFIKSSADST